jgi:chloramphenicol-sensitive protein RarD
VVRALPLTRARAISTTSRLGTAQPHDETRQGLWFALAAYLLWGVFPIYWKQLGDVAPAVLVAHRIAWSFVSLLPMALVIGRGPAIRRALSDPRTRRAMLLSTLLISTNWFLFVYAVGTGRVLAASLGYYMNPLLNVLLGRILLDERLSRAQALAVLLALVGVVNLTLSLGELPWISVALALTFAAYGVVRKTAPVDSVSGLVTETGLVTPLAVLFLLLVPSTGSTMTTLPPVSIALLIGSGLATAVPLLAFTEAAKRLRYTTLGIVQYVAPTCQLALAVLLYDEAFTRAHAVTFACIWSAILLYAGDSIRTARRRAHAESALARGTND